MATVFTVSPIANVNVPLPAVAVPSTVAKFAVTAPARRRGKCHGKRRVLVPALP
ncbi:MAG: hypothetical protein ABI769_18235 [Pseudomonadota bacterium]